MNIAPAIANRLAFVTESWRTTPSQTTVGIAWSDKVARDEIDSKASGLEQVFAFVPVKGQTQWASVSASYWGVGQGATGGDPTKGLDKYHVDIPDSLPNGQQVDLAALAMYGAALMVRVGRNDGSSIDVWLANTKIGGL